MRFKVDKVLSGDKPEAETVLLNGGTCTNIVSNWAVGSTWMVVAKADSRGDLWFMDCSDSGLPIKDGLVQIDDGRRIATLYEVREFIRMWEAYRRGQMSVWDRVFERLGVPRSPSDVELEWP